MKSKDYDTALQINQDDSKTNPLIPLEYLNQILHFHERSSFPSHIIFRIYESKKYLMLVFIIYNVSNKLNDNLKISILCCCRSITYFSIHYLSYYCIGMLNLDLYLRRKLNSGDISLVLGTVDKRNLMSATIIHSCLGLTARHFIDFN